MEYRNPELPEGINASEEHPLKEFGLLVVGILGGLAAITVVLAWFAGALAGYIPFQAEQRLAAHFSPTSSKSPELQDYLQTLAERLAQAEDLPPDMSITVHYVDDDTVNAFATLGGHLVFFRGLLEKMPDENALAMVMAHEIAHIKTRAPLKTLGRGVVIGIVLQMVDAELGTSFAGDVLGQTSLLTQLRFSRGQENEADAIGQAALADVYGGVAGADELFEVLAEVSGETDRQVIEWYRTHPQLTRRQTALQQRAKAEGWSRGSITPLPEQFHSWLEATEE
jgi:predicted Zn-dependent protease